MDNGLLVDEKRTLLDEIIRGLTSSKKYLPSKLFYDKRGSELFDQICELEEYYPTRTEAKILEENLDEIAGLFDDATLFVEFGSGSSSKTRLLLNKIKSLAGYIPIDISEEHLLNSADELRIEFPHLNIIPLAADYTKPLKLPDPGISKCKSIAFFPGSTIGNFTNREAEKFLEIIAGDVGKNGGMIIGIDLVKDKSVIEAAYNDKEGITAKFNLNIIRHINDEFNAGFNESYFEHSAYFNEEESRIEMHLKCLKHHAIDLADKKIIFNKNEIILTEYSHKYTLDSFNKIASTHFNISKVWTDAEKYFAVLYLTVK